MRKVILSCTLSITGLAAFSQVLTSSNLPIIIINTNGQTIPNDPKITADMGIIYNGNGARNNITDPQNHYSGKIGIEIRGQSSQMFPMKSYSIELRDAAGKSQEKSLFGLPKEADWVLYAPYTDKTLMRNFLAYTMTNEMGRWAAHCRFAEVVLNGEYIGIYVFMERIKRGNGRLNIAKMGSSDITGDAVTGGYIFSLDKEPNGWFSSFATPNSTTAATRQYSYVYPKPENIVQQQKDYLKSFVDSFENAVHSQNFQDPVNGVRKFADISSFVDYFIVNELSRNVDGYRLSSYFYKDRNSLNSKIFAGPVWDYDLAFRNADYCDGSNITGWAYRFNYVCPGDGAGLIPFYWYKLVEKDSAFRGQLRCRWKNLKQSSLSEQRINFLIDSVANLTSEARQRHFQKWPVLGQYVWPNPQPIPTSYEGEVAALKEWVHNRLFWLDNNMPNEGACEDWPANFVETMKVEIFPNPAGETNLTIKIKVKSEQPVTLQVTDAIGRLMHSQRINALPPINYINNINTAGWSKGLYFFRFSNTTGEKIITKVIR
jgi:hypothetical protein